jgi:hypothetical protein
MSRTPHPAVRQQHIQLRKTNPSKFVQQHNPMSQRLLNDTQVMKEKEWQWSHPEGDSVLWRATLYSNLAKVSTSLNEHSNRQPAP